MSATTGAPTPGARAGAASGPLDDGDRLSGVITALGAVPTWMRVFDTTEETAGRLHGLSAAQLSEALRRGLPHARCGGSTMFDRLDLMTVSATLACRSAWRLGQRAWPSVLAQVKAGTRTDYRLLVEPKCPFPGHRGRCEFTSLLPLTDVGRPGADLEPHEAASARLISSTELHVRTGAGTVTAPEQVREALSSVASARYLHLPAHLSHDLEFFDRTGSANCILAAEVVLRAAGRLGLRARRSFGVIVLPPFSGLHTWVDFWHEDRWVAFDPHLLRLLVTAGVLDAGHWPVHRSLSGILLRLGSANSSIVRHNGMHCEASLHLTVVR
ncbi:transglutaminase domain-containing protein [Saccharothrix deserti]|uniref:transglutaminase domain-containing protein n=1 Tax=Saccharothrix deserti TaxID=2593674 RepID=UPI00131E03E1|nr:transglutaminase domain-containing protein [Saccharothrix deserti]